MGVKLVIFDMDGVLVDSYDAWFAAHKAAFYVIGKELTKEIFDSRFWGVPFHKVCREMGVPDELCFNGAAALLKSFAEKADNIRVFDGVKELLALLKRKGIKTALLTNTPKSVAEPVLEGKGLHFDCMPDLTRVKFKPEPDGIELILSELGIDKAGAVFVGDTETDERTGRNAGVRTLIVGRDIRSVAELPGKLGL